jgi:uncharacterized protein (TIGR02145 family)
MVRITLLTKIMPIVPDPPPPYEILKYGALYNFFSVDDPRGIVNSGIWKVPTHLDFRTLFNYFGETSVWSWLTIGGKFKEVGLSFWSTPNTGATNECNFNGRGSGIRTIVGAFSSILQLLRVWCSTEADGYTYIVDIAMYNNTNTTISLNDKQLGLPIRIVRPATSAELLLPDGPITAIYTGNNGNRYRCTKIGTQGWVADNLAETMFNRSLNVSYGAYYNWFAINDAKKITSSDNWTILTDAQWTTLRNSNGGYSVVGGLLKTKNTTDWNTPNTGATNQLLFNGKGAGFRSDSGGFSVLKTLTFYWAISNKNTYSLQYNDTVLGNAFGNVADTQGCSVRLINSSTTLTSGQGGTYTGNDGKIYRTICIDSIEYLADNLCETMFRDHSLIPIVTGNSSWAALSTSGMCWPNNTESNGFAEMSTIIPVVSDNAAWAALATAGMCAYNNNWVNV